MAFKHGVYTSELPTNIIATAESTAGLPVVIGTAPVQKVNGAINKPVLCYGFDEYEKKLGYSEDWKKYSLCEFAYSEFLIYGVKPAVFINVLDPNKHKVKVEGKEYIVAENKVKLPEDAIKESVIIKEDTYSTAVSIEGVDYELEYVEDGLEIRLKEGSPLYEELSINIEYEKVDPSKVTANDIIGAGSGKAGLQAVELVYTMFNLTPGLILCPNWSQKAEVSAAMVNAATNIDSLFNCIAITDIDSEVVRDYQQANSWKNGNSYTSERQIVCYPKVKLGEKIYNMSTAIAGVIGLMDAENSDVPYMSPSNHQLQTDGLVLANGEEVLMSFEMANLLNSQGIVTGLNFVGGFKVWGNRTGAYPGSTDPKTFIPVRRMFDWQRNTFILTYWQKVDAPLAERVIKSIVDSESIRLNSLVARGYLLRGDILFLSEENPLTDLIAGKLKLHVYITPPVPAEDIEEVAEFDATAYEKLFS